MPYGCAANVVPSPVGGSLMISGVTKAFSGATNGAVQTGYPGDIGGGVLIADTIDLTADNSNYLSASATDVESLPTSFETTLARAPDTNVFSFQFVNTAGAYASGNSSGTSTVEISASVPEPATWLLMLSGFGGIGLARRAAQRRQATA